MRTKGLSSTPARNSHWLIRLVRWLGCEHVHKWETTHTNGFYTPIQERCIECGEVRHCVLDATDIHREEEWKPGPHPKSFKSNSPVDVREE